MKEQRCFTVELRSVNGRPHAQGFAARYGVLSHPIRMGAQSFRERIKRGAFRSALQRGDDVFMTVNHSLDKVLGRTSSGTLQLRDMDEGLHFDCELPDTQDGNDTAEMMARGDLRECSFGFECDGGDAWSDEEGDDEEGKRCRYSVRTISDFSRIHDTSLVYTPAYPETNAQVVMRSLFPQGLPASVAAHLTVPEDAPSTEEILYDLRSVRLF